MDLATIFRNVAECKTSPQLKVQMHLDCNILGIFSGNQAGKCIDEDERVLLGNGKYKAIKDIVVGDDVVSVDDGYKLVISKVTDVIDSGKKHCFRIETKTGKSVIVSDTHPFLTVDGWKPVKSLANGNHIGIPRCNPFGATEVERQDWEYKLLGYLIGDGCISQHGIGFSNKDRNIIEEVSGIVSNGCKLVHSSGVDYKIACKLGKKNYYIAWLKSMGLMGKNSHTKFVPDFIFSSPRKQIALFISRLFACDGWVDKHSIGYCSVSERLIDDVSSLLLRFGIVANKRTKFVKYNGGRNRAFEINIKRASDVEVFSKDIGIFSKQNKLDTLVNVISQKKNKENIDTVPINPNDLYTFLTRKSKNQGARGKQWEYDQPLYGVLRSARGKTITREKLGKIAELTCDKRLNGLSSSDIYWDQIVSIEDAGEHNTYDLTIDGTHNFIANNICVHNTFGAAYNYFLRIMGVHPVKRLNHLARKIRCISPSLPQPGGQEDQENTQYIEFKKMIPPELVERDITARSMNMIIRRPDGSKTVLMFNSTNQEMQKLGRIQLSSCWHDEESPKAIREESKMRLLAEGGDEIFSLTPTNALSYTYNDVWLRADQVYRTPTVQKKFNLPEWEYPNKGTNIKCIQMATDDNPTLDLQTIEFLFEDITDPDELALRRYGVFKQISGRVHKTYDPKISYIDLRKYFKAA